MAKKKKKLIEIKGTKLQKTCVILQLIVLIAMLVSSIYVNVNNIESGFVTKITDYGVWVTIILLLIPIIFDSSNNE